MMLRHAFGSLLRRPAFTATVVLTLALAIGANVTVFTLVRTVLLQQLPYRQPDRLTWLWHSWSGGETGVFAIPDFVEYRRQARTFEGIAAFRLWGANLTGASQPERLSAVRVSEDFFDILGVSAERGRVFTSADREPAVAVLGHGLWQRRFGGDPQIVGKALTLNGESYLVVGVLPADFLFPLPEAELAVPLAIDSDPYRSEPSLNTLRLVGRQRDGVTAAQAKADLDQTTARLRALYPAENAGKLGVNVVPLHEEMVSGYRSMLLLLWGAVGVVLVMACANLANLFLTQAVARRKEFAVRAALGAGRGHLFRGLIAESAALSFLGGACGVALAGSGIGTLLALAPTEMPRAGQATVGGAALAFALAITVLTTLLFGVVPAVRASRSDPNDALQAQARGATGAGASRARVRLLATQAALALILIVAAGLFLKSFARLLSVSTGMNTAHVLTARIALPAASYPDAASLTRFYDRFVERVQALPGVNGAAIVSILPLSGYRSTTDFAVEGRPPPPSHDRPQAHYRVVSDGYFRTMEIPIVRGREFDRTDRATAGLVAVINQTLARRYFPDDSAVGSTLLVDEGAGTTFRLRIVGIAGDVRHRGLDHNPENDIYVALRQIPPIDVPLLLNSSYVAVRSAADPLTIMPALRQQLASVDGGAAASQVRSMEQVLARAVAPRRFNLQLLGLFAAIALLLAVLGIYGVTTQMALQRQREITIRLALGARPADVLRLVTMDGLKPAAAGVAGGSVVALVGASLVQTLLYEVSSRDTVTFVVAAVAVIGISALAAAVPAVKASRANPARALSDV